MGDDARVVPFAERVLNRPVEGRVGRRRRRARGPRGFPERPAAEPGPRQSGRLRRATWTLVSRVVAREYPPGSPVRTIGRRPRVAGRVAVETAVTCKSLAAPP